MRFFALGAPRQERLIDLTEVRPTVSPLPPTEAGGCVAAQGYGLGLGLQPRAMDG